MIETILEIVIIVSIVLVHILYIRKGMKKTDEHIDKLDEHLERIDEHMDYLKWSGNK